MFSSKKVPHSLNNLRIDIILKELCLVDSRNKALAVIMAGNVFVDEKRINKPGKLVKSNSIVKLKNNDHNWASRGGIKLDNSLKFFKTEVSGKICLDIGCSSGGFTDVLIFYGAKRVYAVDVGYGQFDWRLRNSKKVKLFERTNAKNLNKQIISEPIDLVVCDVSFISIRKIFGNIKGLLNEKYEILSLIKPQFEVEKKLVGKGGIIKDKLVHENVCRDIEKWFKNNFENKFVKITESSIFGQKGNKEFFIYLTN